MPSWRSAQLVKHRDSFTFFYLLPLTGKREDKIPFGDLGVNGRILLPETVTAFFF
jgi:hypothetical protein